MESGTKTIYSCFFVTPIGAEGSEARKRADALLHHVLRPISKDFLEIVRADEVDDPGTITTDIVQRLYSNDLVIADLTGSNPNVFYEVGLRHSFNKPMVHLLQEGEKPPFDLAGERIIFFDIKDLNSVELAKSKIQKQARAALEAKPYRSPAIKALVLESIYSSQSELPLTRDLVEKFADLEEKIDDLSSEIGSLSFDLDSLEYQGPQVVEIDTFTLDRLRELVRIFDQVSPSDMQRFADLLRSK